MVKNFRTVFLLFKSYFPFMYFILNREIPKKTSLSNSYFYSLFKKENKKYML